MFIISFDFSASYDRTVMMHTIDSDLMTLTTVATIDFPSMVNSASLILNGDACIVGVFRHPCFVIDIESARIIGQTQQHNHGSVQSISSGGM